MPIPLPTSDIQTLKVIGFGGLAIFVIRELFKLVYFLIGKRKENGEHSLKESSREKITETFNSVKSMKVAFWEGKNKVDDIHTIIDAKEHGVPLVYNKGLENAINTLNINLHNQTKAIEALSK